MFLPKRPGPYILTLLLVVLIVLVAWMFQALTSPEIREAARRRKAEKAAAQPAPGSMPAPGNASAPPPRAAAPAPAAEVFIDPGLEAKAARLNAPDATPQEDLQLVADFVALYGKARGGNPAGQNEDITAALTGTGGMTGRVFPPSHPAIREGRLTDRWGTPFWFHPNSGNQMEIRSAGPDRSLFTPDDIVQNPSPEGFGATPENR